MYRFGFLDKPQNTIHKIGGLAVRLPFLSKFVPSTETRNENQEFQPGGRMEMRAATTGLG